MKKLLSLFALILISTASFAATQLNIYGATFLIREANWSFDGTNEEETYMLELTSEARQDFGQYNLSDMKTDYHTYLMSMSSYDSYSLSNLQFNLSKEGEVVTAKGTFTANGIDYEFMMTTASSTTSVDQVVASVPTKNGKRIENGRVVIMKDGVKYTTAGTVIK